jgi:glycosyltransferase involved in cell wall biosynthesis
MAMGIPVVASPVGEQKYVVKHGVNGFFAKNEEEWYNYLKMLIEDDDLRRRMGREARKTAEKELSLEVNGKKLYKIIKRIVERK